MPVEEGVGANRQKDSARTVIEQRVRESIAFKRNLLGAELVETLARLPDHVAESLRGGGKVVLFGNGGSGPDATHLAAEFVGRFAFDRDPMPARLLSDNVLPVTAIGNDYTYDLTFARQIKALGAPGDIAIGLSTSGDPANVLGAMRAERERGMFVAAFTGAMGREMASLSTLPSWFRRFPRPAFRGIHAARPHHVRARRAGTLRLAIIAESVTQARPEAVLLDRDGTINVKAPDGDYITRPEDLELLPGAAEAITALNRAGVPVAVVTNQRGVALGRMTERDLAAVHARLRVLLAADGAHLNGIFYCPHDYGVCACRKPGTLLLERARRHLRLGSLRHTVMIGDSWTDVQAARSAGAQPMLLTGARDDVGEDGVDVACTLLQAVASVLRR